MNKLLSLRLEGVEYWVGIVKEDLERGWTETIKSDLDNLDRAVKFLRRDILEK